MNGTDTIYAVSSGRPPAAIAVLRISGPAAPVVAARLAGSLPPPRQAGLRTLRDARGEALDRALVLQFAGARTATGEPLVELHLHGGRAVVAAVERSLAEMPEARPAIAGEFTRRALANGRIDLAQAEGLADLLTADTEAARRAALAASEGAVGRRIREWLARCAEIAALIEAAIDFSDEGDVDGGVLARAATEAATLAGELDSLMARPTIERLNEGTRVVLAGPPNAGKSSLFNALLERDAAIVTPVAGTTRDVLEAAVVRKGSAYLLVDTAGLRGADADPIEAIGIARARESIDRAELVLWLGAPEDVPEGALRVHAQADLPHREAVPPGSLGVSIHQAGTTEALWDAIERAQEVTHTVDGIAIRAAQRDIVGAVAIDLRHAAETTDALIAAEHCRRAIRALGRLVGADATEVMLDRLFARFCVGK